MLFVEHIYLHCSTISKQHNRTSVIAIRLSALAAQSANVERVCKAHGVVHSKVRNRLKHESVLMLLFCYVNLRLLRKDNTKIAEFLESAIVGKEGGAEVADEHCNDDAQLFDDESMPLEDDDENDGPISFLVSNSSSEASDQQSPISCQQLLINIMSTITKKSCLPTETFASVH